MSPTAVLWRATADGSRAKVVDECPSCPENRVNLYKEAFVQIGEVTDGTVNVEWNIVSCNVKSPIILLNKTGTSKYSIVATYNIIPLQPNTFFFLFFFFFESDIKTAICGRQYVLTPLDLAGSRCWAGTATSQ